MKHLILGGLLTASTLLSAQTDSLSCDSLITTTTDKFSNQKTYSSKMIVIDNDDDPETKISFFAIKTNLGITLYFHGYGKSPCIDNLSRVDILFTDGKKAYLQNNLGYNCKSKSGIFMLGLSGKRVQFNKLMTKQIAAIRFWTRDGIITEDLTPEEAEHIRKSLECLKNM